MAIDFACGFECRQIVSPAVTVPDEAHWDQAIGPVSISTSTIRTGTASLRSNAVGAATRMRKIIARRVVAGRAYINFATIPSAAGTAVFVVHSNATSGDLNIRVSNAGAVTCVVTGGTASATIATVSTGVWYRFDWLCDTSTGTASITATVDGGTAQTASKAATAADMVDVRLGFGADTGDVFFDDFVTGDATTDYPFGAGTVESMSPTRDGTHSFTAGDFGFNTAGADVGTGATDVYTYVDDVDLTSTADLIRQKVIRTAGYVQVGFSQGNAPNWWEPQAVNVVSSWHAAGTAADTIGMKLNDGGTLKNVTDEAGDALSDVSNLAIQILEKMLLTAPSGGNWTAGKLESLLIRAGYSDDITPNPYWDGVMLEIAYGIAPPLPKTDPMPPLIAQ